MMGIALRFRPGVFLYAEMPAVLQVIWGWKVMVLPSLGRQSGIDSVMVISMWGTAAGHSCRSNEMIKKRSTCLGTTWSFPGRGNV